MKLVFATHNPNKVKEISKAVADGIDILPLSAIHRGGELPETQPTIEGNAIQKAQYIWEHYQVDCFADDTGLEVNALGGEPGVYSARYAGPQKNAADNMQQLLQQLDGITNRSAQFRTVIALIQGGKLTTFEGVVKGTIALSQEGEEGFGYDPVFIPDGYDTSFASMSLNAKNQISHRARAVAKMVDFLALQQD